MAHLRLGDIAPDFVAPTTRGELRFHEWLGEQWGVLFSHPKDFTPVCTTELGRLAHLEGEFERRGVRVLGLSVDPVEDHERWVRDIESTQGAAPDFPLIGDADRSVSRLYGMLPAPGEDSDNQDTMTVRSVFVIGPDKRIKLTLTYPASTGRNFDELLRVIDSLQLTAEHRVATPVDWQQGDEVIIVPAVDDESAREQFPDGFRAETPYLRYAPQPTSRER